MINFKNQIKARTSFFIIALLMLFLTGCAVSEGKTTQPVSAPAIATGNVENGQKLFMGYVHFQNDGPPCMGCHSIGNQGLLGGGAMGPNLTDVFEKRSQEEIISILSNGGSTISPVMQPIYTAHPLTVNEQADLIAFLNASEGQTESDMELIVVGISLFGSVAAAGAIGFFYRGRMRGARRPLVNKAQKELL